MYFVGLMSGTSLDGVDAALASFNAGRCEVVDTFYLPYPPAIRQQLLELHTPTANELELSHVIALELARLYAQAIHGLMKKNDVSVVAVGCHGQTLRHRPDLGFTLQLNNPSLLAELAGMTVIADFRSRDIAAGGQGAPLVPAFHQAVFSHPEIHRVIVNIGGISNLTNLPPGGTVSGFDCGPGNLLLDAWCERHTGKRYDSNGDWGATGNLIETLLNQCLQNPFLSEPPPKSTGREAFNIEWLEQLLRGENHPPEDVQYTLTELTAKTIADAIMQYCPGAREVYLCGGGAHNQLLHRIIASHLPGLHLAGTDDLGIPADWVEAVAFAWLAKQCMEGKPGNLPAVTGARGPRILGAIYPA